MDFVKLVILLGALPAAAHGAGAAPEASESEPAAKLLLDRWVLAGDRLLDEREFLAALPGAGGDSIPATAPEEAAALLARRLIEAGWWGASVDVERREPASDTDGLVIVLRVEAGEPVVLGEIGTRGNLVLTEEEIFAEMDLGPGETFEEGKFRADVARILRRYSERGYPLARVYPSQFRRTADGRLSFVVRIGEGPQAEIESLRTFGDVSTAERVISRIGGVRPGDTWDVRKIERMSTRLRREGLFTRVGEPRVVRGSRHNRLGLEIEIEEGRTNSIFGVLGYNPRQGGGGDLVGLVDLDLRNILGTARRARIHFERQAGDVQDVEFRFREPWVLGTSISLEGGAAQARRDTLYSRTDLDLTMAVPVGDRATASFALERRNSSFDDVLGESVSEVSTGGSVGITVDARDRRVNPGRGWAAELRVGTRRTEARERRTRLTANGQWLLSLGRRWVVSEEGGFRGVESTGDAIPLYEQFYLGGTNTVRGYREEQFHGEKVWWARSELRYRFSIRSRAYAFFDAGGFSFQRQDGTDSDVLPGGGLGASLETRGSGLVRFEIALGRGDGFSDAKVHAALEQEF